MEFLKNFAIGLAVLILSLIFIVLLTLLLPLMLLSVPILWFFLRGIVFLLLIVGCITLIGYTVRRCTKKGVSCSVKDKDISEENG